MAQAFSYIRFSVAKQELGDSLRRQIKLAEDYALENNLDLDTHSYQDLGISAFKGKNIREGALGAFLAAVDSGIIPKDSTLLVENIDRLSRAVVDEALELFLSIIRRGITIVTLQDKQVYSTERIKTDRGISLIISITYMMRAHEESATKSKRIKAGWESLRLSKVPIKNCPSWLQVNAAGSEYILVTEKVQIVRLIFDLAVKGNGIFLIHQHLEKNKIPQLGSAAKGWVLASVARVLHNQATIGRLVSQKNGTMIEEYYPPIIDKEVFFDVQAKITQRYRVGHGRKGEDIANLFSGLVKCGDCNGPMRFTRTPTAGSKKINVYLQCMEAVLKKGCTSSARINYEVLESRLLKDLLIASGIEAIPVEQTVDLGIEIRQEIANKRNQIDKLINLIDQVDERTGRNLLGRLKRHEVEVDALVMRLKDVPPQREQNGTVEALILATELYKLHDALKAKGGPELKELRLKLQEAIKTAVERIDLPTKVILGYGVPVNTKDGLGEGRRFRQAIIKLKGVNIKKLRPPTDESLLKNQPELPSDFYDSLEAPIADQTEGQITVFYEVPHVGFPHGNRRGRPRKVKAPEEN